MNQPEGQHTRRLNREFATLGAMVAIFCRAHHQPADEYCPECRELLAYAEKRLACCPFQGEKPTCAKCLVHCYAPAMRDRVRAVMRYAGPRMALRHPLMALRHVLDGRKQPPSPAGKNRDHSPIAATNDHPTTRRRR